MTANWRFHSHEITVELIKEFETGEAPSYACGSGSTFEEAQANAFEIAWRNDEFRSQLRAERTAVRQQFTQLISTIVGQPKEKMRRL